MFFIKLAIAMLNKNTHAIFATSTKLLDIKSEVYRSGGDVIETPRVQIW